MKNVELKDKLVQLVTEKGIATTNKVAEASDVTVLVQSKMTNEVIKAELSKAERIVAAAKETKEAAASGETSAASKKKEEGFMTSNQRMLDRWLLKTENVQVQTGEEEAHKEMPMLEEIEAMISNYIAKYRTELGITVESVDWSLNRAQTEFSSFGYNKNRYGWMTVRIAPGVLQYHVFDSSTRKFSWEDYADYDLDASKKVDIFHPIPGSGLLILPIYHSEKMGGFFVMLPNVQGMEEGEFRPIFKTRSNQWDSHSINNNRNFNVALTAHLRMTQKQFIQENSLNRHGFGENCVSCQHSTLFGYKDQVDGDLEDKRSTKILQQPTVDILRELGGSEVPRLYCSVFNTVMDKGVVAIANKQEEIDPELLVGFDDRGNSKLEYTPKGTIKVGDAVIRRQELRKEGTKGICEQCPHYLKSQQKSNAKFNAEVIAAREELGDNGAEVGKDIFISKYFNEWPKAGRTVVDTLVGEKWEPGFPGEYDNALDFRTRGLGGLTVYNSEAVQDANSSFGVLSYKPEVEEYDEELALFEGKVQSIFNVAFNMRNITKEKAEEAFDYAMNKPDGLTEKQDSRWDTATQWLRQSLVWARESEELGATPFETKFFINTGDVEVHAHDLMSELKYRSDEGGDTEYRNFTPQDFIRHLDEAESFELIFEVLETGEDVHVTVDDPEDELDAHLVAGALQESLQRHLGGIISKLRRAVDPKEAANKMLFHDDVKAYILSHLN